MTKYESEVKYLVIPQEAAFERISDLRHLEAIKARLDDPESMQIIAAQVPEAERDKLDKVKEVLSKTTFTQDDITLPTPMGDITLHICQREAPKCLKMEGVGAPLPINLWIQLLPYGESSAKMRVTVGAEVNFLMRGMLSKPLQQAADGLAGILSQVLR